ILHFEHVSYKFAYFAKCSGSLKMRLMQKEKAYPLFKLGRLVQHPEWEQAIWLVSPWRLQQAGPALCFGCGLLLSSAERRSEERRVGKECRSRWARKHLKKKDMQKGQYGELRKKIIHSSILTKGMREDAQTAVHK